MALLVAVLPLQACEGEMMAEAKIDNVQYLVSVLDTNRPTSAEGWTRDVSEKVCPFVTARLHENLASSSSETPDGISVERREIDGQVEIEISRLLSPLWKHALVIASHGTDACNATIYSDAH